MELTTVYDATGANVRNIFPPVGVLMAGYVTGSGGVPWTPTQFNARPGALRIDQSPVQTAAGETADILDVEPGAVTVASVPGRIEVMRNQWRAAARPGQRWPAVYVEESEETPVANALSASSITLPVPFFLSKPMTMQDAAALLNTTAGHFPFIGIQYEFFDDHDVSLVSTSWLNNVSGKPAAPQPGPGAQAGWKFCRRCMCLTWFAQEAVSVCAAGGTHDASQSHTYTLNFTS